MTLFARSFPVFFLATLPIALGGCNPAAPVDLSYIAWCEEEYEVANLLIRDADDTIREYMPMLHLRPMPASGNLEELLEFIKHDEEPPPHPPIPEHIVALDIENQRIKRQLYQARRVLSVRNRGEQFDDPLAALERTDRIMRRTHELRQRGEMAATLVPELQRCAQRLAPLKKTRMCDDPCL